AWHYNPAEVHEVVHGRFEMAPGEGPKLVSGGARVGHEGHERRRSRDRRGRRSLRRCPLGNEREPQAEPEDQDERPPDPDRAEELHDFTSFSRCRRYSSTARRTTAARLCPWRSAAARRRSYCSGVTRTLMGCFIP